MTVVVIGVDPGDSAGVAIITDDMQALVGAPALVKAFQGTAGDAVTLVELVLARYASGNDVTIACERYVNMQTRGRGKTQQPTAQRMIGTLEHLATVAHVRFVLQGPAEAWAIAPVALLRKIEMYQTKDTVDRSDANDANMAIRHALAYMARAHTTLFDALLRRYGVGT
jgi:sigma54-dependent transcription regulator